MWKQFSASVPHSFAIHACCRSIEHGPVIPAPRSSRRGTPGFRRIQILRTLFAFLAGIAFGTSALALDLGSLSNADAVSGLKGALSQGTAAAVSRLGAESGILGNDKVKIALPDAVKRVESGLRLLGMQKRAEELVTAMNRVAENAVPEAKALDRLFLMIAVQEQAIREDPVGSATGMAKKVFGMPGK